tara:strand:+ start:9465 stop:11177 length:1713 start_codon:yes stop_codon:yes gene_type:complete
MVSSTLIQIFTSGPMEKVMYGNPQITYFKSVYKRPTNFASQYSVKTPFTKPDWGDTVTVPIPREADLLGGVYVRIKLSDLMRRHKYIYNYRYRLPVNVETGDDNILAGVSIPDVLNKQQAQNLAGDLWDESRFDELADIDSGTITRENFEESLRSVSLERARIKAASDQIQTIIDEKFSSENLSENEYTLDPQFSSFCNGLGSVIIDYISISVGNKELERLKGEWIWLNSEISYEGNSKIMFNRSIYHEQDYELAESNVSNIDLIIPIPFFFTKDTGSYLPIMAMSNEKIEITIKLNDFTNCITHKIQTNQDIYQASGLYGFFRYDAVDDTDGSPISNDNMQALGEIPFGQSYKEDLVSSIDVFEIIYNYYHVGPEEQTFFLTKKHHYIVPLVKELPSVSFQYNSVNKTQEISLEMRNPVKYILFVLQRKDNFDNHDYLNMTFENILKDSETFKIKSPDINNHIVDRFNLSVDTIDLLDKIPAKILTNIELLTKFKNNSSTIFYPYSFAMYPNETQPSGTLNFNSFTNQFIKLDLVDPNLLENQPLLFRGYYASYNILTIHEGLAGYRYV